MDNHITLPEAARREGVPVWALRRLYEKKVLPEPRRAGLYRLIPMVDLPAIRAALIRAGYLQEQTVGGSPDAV